MSINEIGITGIPTGYETRKSTSDIFSKTTDFMRTVEEKEPETKAAEAKAAYSDKAAEQAEKAFASVGAKAPEEVKKAWMEAAKEVGANGLGVGANGMMTHISQMLIQRVKKSWLNGGIDDNDILGSTVSSAIAATKQALYDLDNPLTANHTRSIEVQQYRMKEKAFYQAFLAKLEKGI